MADTGHPATDSIAGATNSTVTPGDGGATSLDLDGLSIASVPDQNVLAYLSFEASTAGQEEAATPSRIRGPQLHNTNLPTNGSMQGVLWKRRDVFRNRWRPRWFVLHPSQGILSYYLLSEQSHPTTSATNSPAASSPANRRRTNSDFSLDTIDYDVVPRGSIFLGNRGCKAEANETLTRPEEHLYALTITDHEMSTRCHLAARSSTARDRWLEKIQHVISLQQSSLRSEDTAPLASTGQSSRSVGAAPEASIGDMITPTARNTGPETTAFELPQPQAQWRTVPSPKLAENVPPDIIAKVENILETLLPYADALEHSDWKFKYNSDGVHCSSHTSYRPPMIRSILTVKNHHPARYLQLLGDMNRVLDFETNVRSQELLRTYNSHTHLVYKAYQAVWPTSPRDFATAVHWRLLEKESAEGDQSPPERALCLMAFSCKEANELKPAQPGHVRGTLQVSFSLWKPLADGGCVHTRFLSSDLNGQIPKQLAETVLQQQATLPRLLDIHLQKSSSDATTNYQMTYDSMYEALEQQSASQSNDRELTRQDSLVALPPADETENDVPTSANTSVGIESGVLLAPVLVHNVLGLVPYLDSYRSLLFLLYCLTSVRWVLLQHLLQHYHLLPDVASPGAPSSSGNMVTVCHFAVYARGIQSFLAKQQPDESETQRAAKGGLVNAKLEVVHVILRGLARAMRQYPALVARSLPLLPPLYSTDTVWQDATENDKASKWIPSSHQHSVQSIADFLSETNKSGAMNPRNAATWQASCMGPACRVWTTSCKQRRQVDVEVHGAMDSPIAVVVSSTGTEEGTVKARDQFKATLSFRSSDVKACQSFSEMVQEFIQFPEMHD